MVMCPKVGGFIIHAAPLSSFNHGFWSMNPTLHHDFLTENGYAIHYLRGVVGEIVSGCNSFDVPAVERFGSVPDRASIYCVAERESIQPITWPMQRKYRS